MQRERISIIFICFFLILTSCASVRDFTVNNEGFQNLVEYKIVGKVKFKIKKTVITQDFYVKKNKNYLVLKTFDGGIFGLSPTPTLSVRTGDEFLFFVKGKNISNYDKNEINSLFTALYKLEEVLKNRDISRKKIKRDKICFYFNYQGKIKKIKNNQSFIRFKYDSRDEIKKINFVFKKIFRYFSIELYDIEFL